MTAADTMSSTRLAAGTLAACDARIDWRAHEATLRRLVEQGASASAIAREIPNATRCAVLGKAHRLGLNLDGLNRGEGRVLKAASPPRPRRETIDWEAHADTLRRLWHDDLSLEAIAAAIPRATPSAVNHRAQKLGLPSRRDGRSPATSPSVGNEIAATKKGCFKAADGQVTLALEELRGACCRWPYEAEGEPIRYCGAATGDIEAPFCGPHARLAYQPARGSRAA